MPQIIRVDKKNFLIIFILFLILIDLGCLGKTEQVTREQPNEITPTNVEKSSLNVSDLKSPTNVVELYVSAQKYNDFEQMYSLMSTKYKNTYSEENFRRSIEETRGESPVSFVKITGVLIIKDKASVGIIYRVNNVEKLVEEDVQLIEEDDSWRIVHPPLFHVTAASLKDVRRSRYPY